MLDLHLLYLLQIFQSNGKRMAQYAWKYSSKIHDDVVRKHGLPALVHHIKKSKNLKEIILKYMIEEQLLTPISYLCVSCVKEAECTMWGSSTNIQGHKKYMFVSNLLSFQLVGRYEVFFLFYFIFLSLQPICRWEFFFCAKFTFMHVFSVHYVTIFVFLIPLSFSGRVRESKK